MEKGLGGAARQRSRVLLTQDGSCFPAGSSTHGPAKVEVKRGGAGSLHVPTALLLHGSTWGKLQVAHWNLLESHLSCTTDWLSTVKPPSASVPLPVKG